jgi:anaphase-promoting complex subunit 1
VSLPKYVDTKNLINRSFRHAGRQADFKVFTSENFWQESVWINIHYSTELLCYKFDGRSVSSTAPVPCIAAVPIISTRHNIYDTLILECDGKMRIKTSAGRSLPVQVPTPPNTAHEDMARRMAASLSMQIDGERPLGPPACNVVDVRYPAGSRATLIYEDGESIRVSFDFRIKHRLVRQCFEAMNDVLSPDALFVVKQELVRIPARRDVSPWQAFVKAIRRVLRLDSTSTSPSSFATLVLATKQSSNPILTRLAAKVSRTGPTKTEAKSAADSQSGLESSDAERILLALHMVAQDCRCRSDRQDDLLLIGPLLSELSGSLGATNWWDYWQRLVPSCSGALRGNSTYRQGPDADHHRHPSNAFA